MAHGGRLMIAISVLTIRCLDFSDRDRALHSHSYLLQDRTTRIIYILVVGYSN